MLIKLSVLYIIALLLLQSETRKNERKREHMAKNDKVKFRHIN